MKSNNQINYVYINNYDESQNKQSMDINQFVVELLTPSKTKSYYEVLNDNVKIFLDIERIPFDKPNLIYLIINDFIKFMKDIYDVDLDSHTDVDMGGHSGGHSGGDYVLTCNNCSKTHYGLSYHVIFYKYYVSKINKIKNILDNFIYHYFDYNEYIDRVIYHEDLIFKCVNQYGFENGVIDTNTLVDEYGVKFINKHVIINNTALADSIIQNVHNSKLLKTEYILIPRLVPENNLSDWSDNSLEKFIDDDRDDQINELLLKLQNVKLNDEKYFVNELKNHFKTFHTYGSYSIPYDILIPVLTHMVDTCH